MKVHISKTNFYGLIAGLLIGVGIMFSGVVYAQSTSTPETQEEDDGSLLDPIEDLFNGDEEDATSTEGVDEEGTSTEDVLTPQEDTQQSTTTQQSDAPAPVTSAPAPAEGGVQTPSTGSSAATQSSTVPAKVVEIDSRGNILIRGEAVSVSGTSMTINSWGGTWTVQTNGNSQVIPSVTGGAGAGDLSGIRVGDFVGVEGTVVLGQNATVYGEFVRDWTTHPYPRTGSVPAASSNPVTTLTPTLTPIAPVLPSVPDIAGTDEEEDQNDTEVENTDEDNDTDNNTNDEDENSNEDEDEEDTNEEEIDSWDGVVSNVTNDSFTLTTDDDETFTVEITDDTVIEDFLTDEIELEDLEEDAQVLVEGELQSDGETIEATTIEVL